MRRVRCAHSLPARKGKATAFFFYGTLMDRELLSAVLRRRVWPRELRPAVLHGYRRRAVRTDGYPIVLPQRGASVRGRILDRVIAAELARLAAYEGDAYEPARAWAEIPGKSGKRVFFFKPKPGAYVGSSRQWSLAGWRLRHAASELEALAGG
jgi:hypothetical protein